MKGTAQSESFTVLIVEDDTDAQRMYGMFLTSRNCTVFYAPDGRAGIDQAIQLRPDLIVLDLSMPRVDGWTVLCRLRDSSWTADIPIIVLTASGDKRDDALQMGADAYLIKPCPPDVLWGQIHGLFRAPSHIRKRLSAS